MDSPSFRRNRSILIADLRVFWITALVLLLAPRPGRAQGQAEEPLAADWWKQPAAKMTVVAPVVVAPPKPIFDPRTYGAKGDGATYDTAALQKAIDACGGTGGSVELSPGRYLTAELTLHGRMTLYIDKGAVLLGGTNPEDYPILLPPNPLAPALRRSVLFAAGADGLTIDGQGEINGQGKFVKMSGKEPDRPSLIRVFQSRGVTVRNITLRNPRMWTEAYSQCSNLLIDHITVDAPPVAANLDGIDVCDSHDVIVRNCNINSEDDSICLKSHGNEGLQNITIENNRMISTKADGIKIGTATVGPITNILIRNNTIEGAKLGGLNIEDVDGGALSGVTVTGLDMYRVAQPIFIRLGKRVGNASAGDLQPALRPAGSLSGVTIERVRALGTTGARASNTITGISSARPANIRLQDCYIEMPGGITKIPAMPPEKDSAYPQSNMFGDTPAYGLFIRHADGIVLQDVMFGCLKPDARPWLVTVDAGVKTVDCKDLGVVAPVAIPEAGGQ